MDREQFLQAILPYLNGQENISRQVWKGNKLCVTVKDVGAVQLEALEGMDAVAAVELDRGRVTVTPQGLEHKEDIMATDNKQIAKDILAAVGGKGNVNQVAHCMTRLRLNLKDETIPNDEEVKNIKGVLGVMRAGGQYQIIIGQNVPNVYAAILDLVPGLGAGVVNEDLRAQDSSKEPFNIKKIPNKIMSSIVGCLTPILPVLIAAGLIKMIVALIGPGMAGLVTAESDLYRLLTMVGDAGFYFFPVFVGWSGAKQFGCSPVIALLLGGILIHPTMVEIVNAGQPFTVYGIPMTLASYSSTVLPMILITWVASYVEKPLRKYIPTAVSTMLVPLLEVLIMLPLSLCVLAPIGAILGVYLGEALIWLHTVLGPVGVAIIGALFLLLVATGMHLALITTAIVSMTTLGFDDTVLVGSTAGAYACIALYLAFFLKAKTADDRGLGLSVLASQALGGVGEPGMFGVMFRYPRIVAYQMISTFIGALWLGINGVRVYFPGSSNFLAALVFSGGDTANMVNGWIGCGISFVVAFLLMMVLGYDENAKSLNFKKKGKVTK